ncbi:ABC transporter ATP-binding protein [Pseudaestuariivita rosea]|uniref:ATP-binding cassette domain-containing protein n=1 Tax=Pseudaestuariivita rosea TaxID=2763263 RepID=UPI001ABB8C43|nr:ABC transporter ATP-binding protein [Pseudaestuariivita rosea]
MKRLPRITSDGRFLLLALLAILALGQAAAAAIAAVATREVFLAFRQPTLSMPQLALIALGAAGILIAGFRYVERIMAERVGQDYAAALRLKLFRHLTQLSARDIAKRRNGAMSMRFVGDLAAVRGWVSLGLARLISAIIVLPIATGVLFWLNRDLGAAAIVPLSIGVCIMLLTGPRLGPAHKKLRQRRAQLAADMSERIPHAPELRLLGRIQLETDHLNKRTEKLIDSALERARGAAFLRAVPDATAGLAAVAVFWMALQTGARGADAAAAMAAVGLMLQPMRDLAGVWDRHRAWVVARDKCEKLLDVPKLDRPKPNTNKRLVDAPPAIHIKNLSAGPLKKINASVEPGRSIAIVGANGVGKSTLLSLMAGLEQPHKGQVTLDGRPPQSLTAFERRNLITMIGTRSAVLAGSLRRAFVMAAADRPTDDTVLQMAERYGLTKMVERLGGLDGKVAEAGRNMSAGELRRLLLTRAALSKPKLLLLDEPDDALDTDGPKLVGQLLAQVDATTLMVTHNPKIAILADEIWFVDQGGLAETGSADQLLAVNERIAAFLGENRTAA